MKLIKASRKIVLPLLTSIALLSPLHEGRAQFSNTPVYSDTRAAGHNLDSWKRSPLFFRAYGSWGLHSDDLGIALSGYYNGGKWQTGAGAGLSFLSNNNSPQTFGGYVGRDLYRFQLGVCDSLAPGWSAGLSLAGEIAGWMNRAGDVDFSHGYTLGAFLETENWAFRAGVQKPTPYKLQADSAVLSALPLGRIWHPLSGEAAFEFRPTRALAFNARWVDTPSGIDTVYAGASYRLDGLFGDSWSWLADLDLATKTREAQERLADRLRFSLGRGNKFIVFRLWREKPFWGDPQFGISFQGRLE